MKTTLTVAFDIQPAAGYKSLSSDGRSQARKQFYAVIQELLPLMVTEETSDPSAVLAAQLGKAPGAWQMDSGVSLAANYYWDAARQRWICVSSGELLLDGAPVTQEITIEGVTLKASYTTGWSHEGPVQAI